MNFLASWFLPALAAVAGPTLIHLLNRRRYRTQQWAAMQFLREAVKRNRRAIQVRDLLLLAIRTLVVLLFVLSMARPYWIGGGQQAYNGNEPIHAVVVLDNSLSMAYTALDKSLLEDAKAQAAAFVETLPSGSEVSIIPMCTQPHWFSVGAYSSREGALNAIEQVHIVDQAANLRLASEQAALALEQDSSVQTKRVIMLGDLQTNGWEDNNLEETLRALGDVQIVAIQPSEPDNSWVSDFYLRDGIADAESTAHFVGTIRHEGVETRNNVTVSLIIDDQVVAEQLLQLQPGQATTVHFEHQFITAGSSKEPEFARAELTLDTDRLPMDDRRVCVVPVIARVPVVFIDQYGRDEDLERGRLGESFMLRHLLAPTLGDDAEHKSLIDVIHRTIEDFTIEDLQDARCVIISGSVAPNIADVVTLKEYAEQGGQILVTAGGLFEATSWNTAAWDGGNGFLPIGVSP
ncbi:MAG: BatA domain-containing protein, partial [Planctomycetota bacterium]|nr:BatA domain-containing protein [Planctomycetota bacterium]